MNVTDEQLMIDIRHGSLPAFELLLQRWERRMTHYFARWTGSMEEAEDMRQELFCRIYQKSHTYDSSKPFQSWIYRVATNLLIDQARRKPKMGVNSRMPNETNDPIDGIATSETIRVELESDRLKQLLQTAMDEMPMEQRSALMLKHFEQLQFSEIAEVLGVSESTVKSRVYRGLEALRKKLKQMGILEDCLQAV